MTARYKLDDLPAHAPHSLNLHMIEGVSYEQAKQFVEHFGVIVLPQDRVWEQLSILRVRIPSGENLDEWITKFESQIAIVRITKVPIHSLGYNLKTM